MLAVPAGCGPCLNAILNAIVRVTGWTQNHLVDAAPEERAGQRPEQYRLDWPHRTLNPQVLGSNPRGRTTEAQVRANAIHLLLHLAGTPVETRRKARWARLRWQFAFDGRPEDGRRHHRRMSAPP